MTWLAISVVIFAAFFAYQFRSWRRLCHIPGPALASWTNLWLVRQQLTGRIHLTFHDLVSKHGPLVRVAPNMVICGDAAAIRRIWAARSPWKRSWWYRGMRIDPYRDSSFSTRDDAAHNVLRGRLQPGYSGRDVEGLHELVAAQVRELVRLLSAHVSRSGEGVAVVDMAQKITFFALDTVTSLAFGKPLGFMATDADRFGYVEVTTGTVYLLVATALVPGAISLMQSPYLKWVAPRVRDMAGIGDVVRAAEEVVAERFGAEGKEDGRRDMLGSFVRNGLSQREAETEALVQIIGGSETTATAIQAVLLQVMTAPRVYARLRAEVDDAREGTAAEAAAMPYLQAVVRESLRMMPPAAALYPKVCEGADQVLCGVVLPAGTDVAWSPWSVMRDRTVFGADADVFRPERWLRRKGDGGGKGETMEQTVMMAFAAGSRWECLGRNIAMLEMNMALVELFRRFDFELADATRPWKSFNAGMFSQTEFNVVVRKRM